MGGKPITSLALVCFPDKADITILERILAGGLSKMIEAGCTVVGGHSIRDEETKFGYSVTGVIHPQRVLANQGAQPGDKLLFTKALGTGVISTAIKKGVAKPEWIDAAVKSMTTLNKVAAEVIAGSRQPVRQSSQGRLRTAVSHQQYPNDHRPKTNDRFAVHSLTDVTGFGLIGHAREMALASNVGLIFNSAKILILEGALDCIRAGYIPGGLKNNRDFAECMVGYSDDVPEEIRTLLFDPQTAGGLLISVAADDAESLARALQDASVPAVEIGEVVPSTKPLIRIDI
jgi:selenide,water dikinase